VRSVHFLVRLRTTMAQVDENAQQRFDLALLLGTVGGSLQHRHDLLDTTPHGHREGLADGGNHLVGTELCAPHIAPRLAFQKIMSKYLDRQFARRLQERLKPHEIVCRLSLYWSDPQDA
jgi:hypothetical protein